MPRFILPLLCGCLLLVSFALQSCGVPPGQKLLRFEVEQNGELLLATSFDASDRVEKEQLWKEASEVPVSVEMASARVNSLEGNPLMAEIPGRVQLRILHVDRLETEAVLIGIRLQRLAADSNAWSLAPEEVARVQQAVSNPPGKLRVFILAGQSNMVGSGIVAADVNRNDGKGTLEYLARSEETRERFSGLIDENGDWRSRDDVLISYFERSGPITVGYGAGAGTIGPELGFGWTIGELFEDPVLLIKVAWGGKAIGKEFRPPSAGGEVGESYTAMFAEIRRVLDDLDHIFPELIYDEVELMGIAWHQGWNDRVNQAFNDVYEENLSCFIRDARKELGVAKLPFVIAETGMSGHEENHPRAVSLMKAQAAVAQRDEFRGNVAFVGTKDFWRDKSLSPSGQAYHWNNNAETFYLIGEGMAVALESLLAARQLK
ncbi:MAG: hypothetical protein H8E15_06525 [Planctomycetes bacterium]|nr:hypothetical protein [Planctomycetota bacterium]